MKGTVWLLIITSLCVGLMGYSLIIKGGGFGAFETQMGQSPMLTRFVRPIAVATLVAEGAVALLLLIPRTRLIGFYACYTLMALFTGYIAILLTYDGHVPCACGGVIGGLAWWQHLLFNGVFVGLSVVGVFLTNGDNRARVANARHP